jgi:hypothetical protein
MNSMRADEFKAILDRRPFRPVRVMITSGQYVDILHPEAVIVARSYFVAAVRPNRQGISQGSAWYSLIHVVKVIPLSRLRKRRKKTGA